MADGTFTPGSLPFWDPYFQIYRNANQPTGTINMTPPITVGGAAPSPPGATGSPDAAGVNNPATLPAPTSFSTEPPADWKPPPANAPSEIPSAVGGFGAPPTPQKGMLGPYANLPRVDNMTDDEADKLGLIGYYESGWRNVRNYKYNDPDPTKGIIGHTAQGLYQITNTTWNQYKPSDIAAKNALDATPEEQTRVALAILRSKDKGAGMDAWAPYDTRLAKAMELGIKPRHWPGTTETASADQPQQGGGGDQQGQGAQSTDADAQAKAQQQAQNAAITKLTSSLQLSPQQEPTRPAAPAAQSSLQDMASMIGLPSLDDPYDIKNHPIMGRLTELMSNPLLQGALGGYLGYLTTPRWEKAGGRIAQGALGGLGAFNQAEQAQLAMPYKRAQILESLAKTQQGQAEAYMAQQHGHLYETQNYELGPNPDFAKRMIASAQDTNLPYPVRQALLMWAPEVNDGRRSSGGAMDSISKMLSSYTAASLAPSKVASNLATANAANQRAALTQAQVTAGLPAAQAAAQTAEASYRNAMKLKVDADRDAGTGQPRRLLYNMRTGATMVVPDKPGTNFATTYGQDWTTNKPPPGLKWYTAVSPDGMTTIPVLMKPGQNIATTPGYGKGWKLKDPDELTMAISRASGYLGYGGGGGETPAATQTPAATSTPAPAQGQQPPQGLLKEAASDPKMAAINDWEPAPANLGLPPGSWISPSTNAHWSPPAAS